MRYKLAERFFKETAYSYDRVVAITTLNRDQRWKESILELVPESNYCLDLASGTGILTKMLKSKVKNVIGLDLMYDSCLIAKRKGNEVLQGAAEYIPFKDDSFDVITASYLPKYCEPKITIRECARVLRKDGLLIMHDFTYPNGIMRLLWHLYFKILKFVGLFVRSWRDVFYELDDVIKESRWVEELKVEIEANGFKDIQFISLSKNTAGILYCKLG